MLTAVLSIITVNTCWWPRRPKQLVLNTKDLIILRLSTFCKLFHDLYHFYRVLSPITVFLPNLSPHQLSYICHYSSSFSQLPIPRNPRCWDHVLFQEEDTLGAGTHIGGCDGHRVFVRGRNSFRLTYPAEDRRAARAYDPGVGAASAYRLLRHSDSRLPQWPLQPVVGQTTALHTHIGRRNPYRCCGFI